MPKTSLRWFAKPDLEAELRHALGRQPEDWAAALAEVFGRPEPLTAGLKTALANVFRQSDEQFTIHIIRRSTGRPVGSKRSDTPSEAVAAFVNGRVLSGVPFKAAVADACVNFKVSRSTVYGRLKDARSVEQQSTQRLQMTEIALNAKKPGGAHVSRGKRSLQKQKRRKTVKQARSYRHVRVSQRELERAMRMERLSKKRRDITD